MLTALEKLPADRFATAAEFAEALQGAPGSSGARKSTAARARARVSASPSWSSRLRDPLVLALAAIAIVAAALAASKWRATPSAPAEVVRFTLPAALNGQTSSVGYNIVAASPDGRTLVYVGRGDGARQQLMLRTLDDIVARPLPGTEDAIHPIFSPDGHWVAFIRGNQLYKIAVDGAAPLLLGTAPGTFNGASWSSSGVIVVSSNTALYSVPEAGGTARVFKSNAHPGEYILSGFAAGLGRREKRDLFELDRELAGHRTDRDRRPSVEVSRPSSISRGIMPLGVIDGTLVYVSAAGVLMGAPIDVEKRRLLGPPVQLIDHIALNAGTGLAFAALSRTGTLIYQSGTQQSRLVVVGKDGALAPSSRIGIIPSPDFPRTENSSRSPSDRPITGTSGWTSSRQARERDSRPRG